MPACDVSELSVTLTDCYEALKLFLTRKFGCPQLAEEVIQETWMRVHRLSPVPQVNQPPSGEYAPLTDVVNAAQVLMPSEAKLLRLYLPRHPQAAMKLRFSLAQENRVVLFDVTVNPFTAEVLGQREWGGYLMSFLYKLHYTLQLDDEGKTIIGILGLVFFCVLFSGIYLWWPKLYKFFRAFTFKRSANGLRFIYDLHKTFGIYAAVVLVAIAFSGIYMIFPHYVKPMVGWISPLTNVTPPKLSIDTGAGMERLSVDEISKIARELLPQATLQRIFFRQHQRTPIGSSCDSQVRRVRPVVRLRFGYPLLTVKCCQSNSRTP